MSVRHKEEQKEKSVTLSNGMSKQDMICLQAVVISGQTIFSMITIFLSVSSSEQLLANSYLIVNLISRTRVSEN